MGNIYVKLNKEYCKQKDAKAIDVYGQLIYPGSDRWVLYEDKWLDLIKIHENFKDLEIKTQEEIDEENKKYKEEIEQLVMGNWKRAEKEINLISDKQKLNDIKKIAELKNRESVIKLVKARLEELSF